MTNKVVVYTCTPSWFDRLETAIRSLLVNNPDVEKVHVFSAGSAFDLIKDERIVNHDLNDQKYQIFDKSGPNYNSHWGPVSLARIGLPLWLDYDEVLYLDTDTIVDAPLDEIWNLEMGDKLFAGVPEPYVTARIGALYFNSGVLVLNLKSMRKIARYMIKRINEYKLTYPDQDVINEFGAMRNIMLDDKYNVTHFIPSEEIVIKHYADAHKEWVNDYLYLKYKK